MKTKNMTLCALFVCLITAGAFIRIPTPVTEITLQFPVVMLAGILLGGKRALLSVSLYIFMGIIGLPVFTSGGGITYLLKPSFGYILGFAAAGFIVGILCKQKSDFKNLLFSCLTGTFAVYFIGMLYYILTCRFYLGVPVNPVKFFLYVCAITLPKDIVFCFLVSALGKRLLPLISKI